MQHAMKATEHSFTFRLREGVAHMQVNCFLKDVEGGQWLTVDPQVGHPEWPLFPTVAMLKDELEEKFSFYTGKTVSVYRALHVNGQVQPSGQEFTDEWALNENDARFGVYIQVDSFQLPADGPRACDMRGAGPDADHEMQGAGDDEAIVEAYVLDSKFKGWKRLHIGCNPTTMTVTCAELKEAVLDAIKVEKNERKMQMMRIFKNNYEHVPKPVHIPQTDHIKVMNARGEKTTFTVALNPSLAVETCEEASLGSSWNDPVSPRK